MAVTEKDALSPSISCVPTFVEIYSSNIPSSMENSNPQFPESAVRRVETYAKYTSYVVIVLSTSMLCRRMMISAKNSRETKNGVLLYLQVLILGVF